MTPFTHLDNDGHLHMVDVSDKEPTLRRAEASCVVHSAIDLDALAPTTTGLDPVVAARLVGIQAAKRTAQMIPLCHPLNLNDVQVAITKDDGAITVRTTVVAVNRTGVEMEALAACAVAALSLVNALVTLDATARFEDLVLERKSGGTSGDWGRLIGAGPADTPDEGD